MSALARKPVRRPCIGYHLFVHAENAGQREGVVLQPLFGVVTKDPSNEAFLHPVDAAGELELHGDAIVRKLVSEACQMGIAA